MAAPKPLTHAKKLEALASHGGSKNVIEFSEPVLHGRLRFGKGEVVQFECAEAAGFFDVAFNGTEFSDKEPTRIVSADELNVDPDSDGETIDPDTTVAYGREGVVPGSTIAGHLLGLPPGSPELVVQDGAASPSQLEG